MKNRPVLKSSIFLFFFLQISFSLYGDVDVLFHPYDKTLDKIGTFLEKANEQIDIAMYNIDVTDNNPVIQAIKTSGIQNKLKKGTLNIRFIYEGFEEEDEIVKKLEELENIGIDVKRLKSGLKMHHKFSVIDGYSENPSLVTGSANWSMFSFRNYNENILYFTGKPEIARNFQKEFELLWTNSEDFGKKLSNVNPSELKIASEENLKPYFNSSNFKVTNSGSFHKITPLTWTLTKSIVGLISEAKESIDIATTRFKIRPLYEAIIEAMKKNKNLKVRVVLGMDGFPFKATRKPVESCEDIWDEECSSDNNFAWNLEDNPYTSNIEVKFKYYNFNKAAFLSDQMHNKYIIIDKKSVGTGSFNWSFSAEYGHIENVVVIKGGEYKNVIEKFNYDFERLWKLNHEKFDPLVKTFEDALKNNKKISCSFEPMVLNFTELDYYYDTGKRVGKNMASACK